MEGGDDGGCIGGNPGGCDGIVGGDADCGDERSGTWTAGDGSLGCSGASAASHDGGGKHGKGNANDGGCVGGGGGPLAGTNWQEVVFPWYAGGGEEPKRVCKVGGGDLACVSGKVQGHFCQCRASTALHIGGCMVSGRAVAGVAGSAAVS